MNDWSQGVPLAYLRQFCDYWANTYDWPKREERLNTFPQFLTEIGGLGIHFLHVRSPHASAMPLLLTHGWPGSIVEFIKVIPLLTDPAAHGGNAADAFHVVCPSLPGYGFSDKPKQHGWGVEKIARAWTAVRPGGDWSAAVTTAIAIEDTEHCHGIHLNMPTVRPDPETMSTLTDEEKEGLAAFKYYQDWDSGYSKEQSTGRRPSAMDWSILRLVRPRGFSKNSGPGRIATATPKAC